MLQRESAFIENNGNVFIRILLCTFVQNQIVKFYVKVNACKKGGHIDIYVKGLHFLNILH